MDGDVVSQVEYSIGLLYEDAEKKFGVLATDLWASLIHDITSIRRFTALNYFIFSAIEP